MTADSLRHRVEISTESGRYSVRVWPELLTEAGTLIEQTIGAGRYLAIIDGGVDRIYGQRIRRSLTRLVIDTAVVPPGERSKSLTEVARLASQATRVGLGRDGAVITVGGGMVSDLGGFLAAIYMRGIRVIHVPTTLLAMVDAAVGGKTAVNLPEGKNLLGAFHQPSLVLADPSLLATLTAPDLAAGLAEAIKLGLACDAEFYRWLTRNLNSLLFREPNALSRLVAEACRIKGAVVAHDERDIGEREALNLGHTVAHALETLTGFSQYRHGEAVAIGMVAAARLAEQLELATGLAQPLQDVLVAVGLPTQLPPVPVADLLVAMGADKKRRDNTLRWVLPTAVGSVELGVSVPEVTLKNVLSELGARA